jgi:hypothetical protein
VAIGPPKDWLAGQTLVENEPAINEDCVTLA